ncbi:hypothetical protein FA09DRAFT_170112 [Tilletiopsis washingtonensis]|uniref:Uncharacterized protein n=1 Tax=Tilletiopsis washingtonensis TaxID=58919 RepID=A0A316YYR7_9BASI|nr:hypothetical protein FA09DRAFT_170112 [Tilletiopsis washingtonensis]PWN94607.1 hypothetical protein FA09DRAFT_170112 [Tilletiopsis washingtonensis]
MCVGRRAEQDKGAGHWARVKQLGDVRLGLRGGWVLSSTFQSRAARFRRRPAGATVARWRHASGASSWSGSASRRCESRAARRPVPRKQHVVAARVKRRVGVAVVGLVLCCGESASRQRLGTSALRKLHVVGVAQVASREQHVVVVAQVARRWRRAGGTLLQESSGTALRAWVAAGGVAVVVGLHDAWLGKSVLRRWHVIRVGEWASSERHVFLAACCGVVVGLGLCSDVSLRKQHVGAMRVKQHVGVVIVKLARAACCCRRCQQAACCVAVVGSASRRRAGARCSCCLAARGLVVVVVGLGECRAGACRR